RCGAASDHAQARMDGGQEVSGRSRHPDRILIQPRCVFYLSDARDGIHSASDQHAPFAWRPPADPWRVTSYVEGSTWRPGIGHRLAETLNAVPSTPAIGLVLVLSVDWFIGMARALGNL